MLADKTELTRAERRLFGQVEEIVTSRRPPREEMSSRSPALQDHWNVWRPTPGETRSLTCYSKLEMLLGRDEIIMTVGADIDLYPVNLTVKRIASGAVLWRGW
jgi:hypothetical protein